MDIIRAPGNININGSDGGSSSLEPLLRSPHGAKSKDNNGGVGLRQHNFPDEQQQQQQHRQPTGARNSLKGTPGGPVASVGTAVQQQRATPAPPPQCPSTDSGNSSCVSSGSSNGAGGSSVSGGGGGGGSCSSASGASGGSVVDEPETKKPHRSSRSPSASSLKNCNVYVNRTYDDEGASAVRRAAAGSAVSISIDEGIDASGPAGEAPLASEGLGGGGEQEEEEIKPLLEVAHERRKTKSIVKSPSEHQSIAGERPVRQLSLQFSQPESVIVADRPVHHVQFRGGSKYASVAGGGAAGNGAAPGLGTGEVEPHCSSPVGSILSHGSATSSSSSGSSSSSNENSSLGAYAEARPPDGGWGWVVCFAAFMVNLIADGVTFSFGVMYIELLAYFGEGKGKTAWVGSLFMAMPLLCGPVASFLTDRYGCRKVTIIGSILASIGFALSAYATSIEMLYLTFGILSGFGLSLCYVAAVVIVAYYFDKKRSFATGLSVCGSGIGTFVFASLTQILLDEYGWRGTTLILAGVFLNMCLCGLLMRDLEWTTHKSKQKRRKQQQQQQQADSVSNSTNTAGGNTSVLMGNGGIIDGVPAAGLDDAANDHLYDLDDPRLFSSLITLPTYLQNGSGQDKLTLEVLAMLSKQHNMHDHHVLQNLPVARMASSHSFSQPLQSPQSGENVADAKEQDGVAPAVVANDGEQSLEAKDNGKQQQQQQQQQGLESDGTGTTVVQPSRHRAAGGQRSGARGRHGEVAGGGTSSYEPSTALPPPVFLRRVHSHSTRGTAAGPHTAGPAPAATASYLKDLRMHRHSLTYRGAMLNIQRYRLRASSCPDIYRNSMTTIAKEKSAWYAGVEEFRTLLVSILDFSYFSDVHYLLFAVSNFLLYTFYDVPYVYLGDNATQMGFSHTQSSMLIAIIGILNMVGEVVLGWMGDRKSVNANYTYAICMALCGLVTALVPLFKDYTSLSVLAGGFGLFIAANYSLTSIILVELITLERFTNAYGLLLLVQGVANLVGPPLAGWISDLTDSYDLAFYLAGFFIVISGALLLVLPTILKVRKIVDKRRRSSALANGDSVKLNKKVSSASYQQQNNNVATKPVALDLKTTFVSNGKRIVTGVDAKNGSTPNGMGTGGGHVFGLNGYKLPIEEGATV
ncbi:AGAP001782-PA [Anopheles gambiae str. PEST]|uniref:AGAP001782-PA n=1 Tax=Anopheles gambiae TaxID=7165 RepID=Q7PUS2_ANOGA|nr:AGAP001782-PA [Anopheles gambiae str. PEST]